MSASERWDVVVVGAGPGGAAAAKGCAEKGIKTLVLERKALPRDKVCSGMIMGPWAHDIIRDHFGTIPQKVLTSPPVLKGHQFHVPGARPEVLDWPTPLAWRKDLDAWLMEKAQAAGAEVRERVRLTQIEPHGQTIRLLINGPDGDETLSARWVIGADGANSVVRKSLFPNLKVPYSTPLRECYSGALDLEKEYFHWFFPRGLPRPRFNINHKDDFFLIEGSGIRELRTDISRILAPYGLDPSQPPVWRDGCLIPKIHQHLMDGSFHPARGNVLLVGDAAGLIFPITFEGIGSALKSGLAAAEAVRKSNEDGWKAAGHYGGLIQPLLRFIQDLLSCQENLFSSATMSSPEPGDLARSLKEAYEKTLKPIDRENFG